MPLLLALAPIPALVAALFADNLPLVLGNAQFALSFAMDKPGRCCLVAAILWIAAGVFPAATALRGAVNASRFVVCWLMTLTGCVGVFLAAIAGGLRSARGAVRRRQRTVLQGGTAEALRASTVYLGLALIAEAFLAGRPGDARDGDAGRQPVDPRCRRRDSHVAVARSHWRFWSSASA